MANSIARRAALAALLVVSLFGQNRARRVEPKDGSFRDPSLVEFLAKFKAVASKHDVAALLAFAVPDIQNGFGCDNGFEAFRICWEPDTPNTELWPLLDEVLSKAGDWSEETFIVPYYSAGSNWPDYDAFEFGFINADRVRLRVAPSSQSATIRLLSYDIVEPIGGTVGWLEIKMLDGTRGFVANQFYSSPIGFRAGFEKRDGVWKWVWWARGD
jgi:hypothetical protein